MSLIDLKWSMSRRIRASGRSWRAERVGLPLEVFEEVAVVVQPGEGVEDRQPVEFLVILGLDVAAGQEAEQAVAHPQESPSASGVPIAGRSLTKVPLVLPRSVAT